MWQLSWEIENVLYHTQKEYCSYELYGQSKQINRYCTYSTQGSHSYTEQAWLKQIRKLDSKFILTGGGSMRHYLDNFK